VDRREETCPVDIKVNCIGETCPVPLVEERTPTTVDVIRKRLKRVMNPMAGLDLVRTKLVKEIELAEGVARVVIDLPAEHQFAANIREEIVEKIEPLWDVEQVVVEFTE